MCVCVQNPDSSFGLVFFQSIDFDFFCLKVKVKVGLLKLTLKLVFPHNYFQILRQKKNQNPYIWKTLKFGRETIIWSSYTGHSNIWEKSGSVVWRCFFPEHLILNFFRLKVKVKVDLLKLTLKLVFPHNHFQIQRQQKINHGVRM